MNVDISSPNGLPGRSVSTPSTTNTIRMITETMFVRGPCLLRSAARACRSRAQRLDRGSCFRWSSHVRPSPVDSAFEVCDASAAEKPSAATSAM